MSYGWNHIKPFERIKYLLLKRYIKYRSTVKLPSSLNLEFDWWLEHILNSYEKIEISKTFLITIFTDASKTGWGAHLEGNSIHGFWSPWESQRHINFLELLAVLYALKSFGKTYKNCNILLRIDNKTTIAGIN